MPRIPPPPTHDFFIYSTQPHQLKPGEVCSEYIAIMRDGDFWCQSITKTSLRPFQFRIRSSHNDRMWSNFPLHSDLLGTPDKPLIFPKPIWIPRTSTVTVEIIDLSTARQKKNNTVSLQFMGTCVNQSQDTISGEAYFR